MKILGIIVATLAVFLSVTGCGSGGQAVPPTVVAVAVSPGSVNLDQGATKQFTGTVSGTASTAVTWSVQEGAAGGAITSAGVYTAPAAAGTFHLVATSQADSSKRAMAEVIVPAVSISVVNPGGIALDQGGTQTFTAAVSGTVNKEIAWSVQEGAAGGSITSAGVYTAPAVAGTFHVLATSQADRSKSATAQVAVRAVFVAVSPELATLDQGAVQTFVSTVTGTVNTAVSWSVLEAGGGSIATDGVYTAPPAAGSFQVIATSVADSSKTAASVISVPEVQIRVLPGSVGVARQRKTQFSAQITGTVDQRVAWSVQENTGGTITSDGLYTAPSIAGSFHVIATSVASPAKTAVGNVAVVDNGFRLAGNMNVARAFHNATLLQNGEVLLTGSIICIDVCDGAERTAELYDPASGQFRFTGEMTMPRNGHTATLLPDGRVLITGGAACGEGAFCASYSSAELYDPPTGVFTSTGSMAVSRQSHTATTLPDGKVLVTGGWDGQGSISEASAEIYDPSTGTFSSAGSMILPRESHSATLLADGRVLLVGGFQRNATFDNAPAEIFNPSNGTFATTGAMPNNRDSHAAVLLADGRVLITGGECWNGWDDVLSSYLADALVFDPATAAFGQLITMNSARFGHTTTLLLDGKVLVAGNELPGSETYSDAELFDPATSSFSVTGNMATPRSRHTATLLPDGRALITGGFLDQWCCGGTATNSAELYE